MAEGGAIRLGRLTWQDIEDLYAAMRRSGRSATSASRLAGEFEECSDRMKYETPDSESKMRNPCGRSRRKGRSPVPSGAHDRTLDCAICSSSAGDQELPQHCHCNEVESVQLRQREPHSKSHGGEFSHGSSFALASNALGLASVRRPTASVTGCDRRGEPDPHGMTEHLPASQLEISRLT
jgi:hypothetical protein